MLQFLWYEKEKKNYGLEKFSCTAVKKYLSRYINEKILSSRNNKNIFG